MTGASPRTPRAGLILALGAMSALGPLSLDMYLPALPALADDLGASDAVGQLTMSACLIGLALGQIVIGPLSDRFGRRRPLLIGLGAYTLLSVLCALAPSAALLVALRALQGFAGAAGIVLARAVVRDSYRGREVARHLALLIVVSSIAPLAAPLLGGQLLKLMDWRGVFVVLAGIGVALTVLAAFAVRESLPGEDRHGGGLGAMTAGFGRVLREPLFTASTIGLALSGAAIFTYISASPFVLQGPYGLTDEQFSFVFAANSAGVASLGYVNAALVRRVHPRVLLLCGSSAAALGSLCCLAAVLVGAGLWPMLAGLFVTVASGAFFNPNATALGLSLHARDAGTASAVIGTGPFLVGSAIAPLALAGGASAATMAALIAALMVLAWLVALVFVRPLSRRAHELSGVSASEESAAPADPVVPLPLNPAPDRP
ncbi:multidrug effflux MFS transporter [Microbacterium sp. PRC9]|uniref:multidrug effflux MFS transporter n=1 Tax=Microbacterium sp. PRC9 TaxID=2962591 RepID=UPI002882171C|nr:multidrug effflux MFS transporter [Microbacterium sp. PRC9]MDT0144532.1 multidrug effflux MFS transporter [Microbacterium sp. PRC9]